MMWDNMIAKMLRIHNAKINLAYGWMASVRHSIFTHVDCVSFVAEDRRFRLLRLYVNHTDQVANLLMFKRENDNYWQPEYIATHSLCRRRGAASFLLLAASKMIGSISLDPATTGDGDSLFSYMRKEYGSSRCVLYGGSVDVPVYMLDQYSYVTPFGLVDGSYPDEVTAKQAGKQIPSWCWDASDI